MARKKSPKQKVVPVQEFSSSPFKNLKGLSALAEQKTRSQDRVVNKTTTGVKGPAIDSGDHQSFAEEMDSLGVRPLSGRVVPELVQEQEIDMKPPQSPAISRDERERTAFLDAVGSVERSFKDEWPEDEPVKPAVPRRMKQVERGLLELEAELDLHGLTIDEASAKVRFFLQDVGYQGLQTVLIITGKGLHSSDGPVLRQAMEALLHQERERVLEWGLAPRRFGGDGALVVFLRQVPPE